jgi:hypothetical protein
MISDRTLLQVAVLVFTLCGALSAQTGSITGTVKDTSGAAIARRWSSPIPDAASRARWTLTLPVTTTRPRSPKELTTLS